MREIYLKNSNWIVRSRRANSLLSPSNGEKAIMAVSEYTMKNRVSVYQFEVESSLPEE